MVTKKKLLEEIVNLSLRVDYLSKRCDILEFKNEARGESCVVKRAGSNFKPYSWLIRYVGKDGNLYNRVVLPAPSQWVKPVINGRFVEFWVDAISRELLEVYQVQENELVKVDLELYKNYIKESEKEDV